jgi:hypothetical protein
MGKEAGLPRSVLNTNWKGAVEVATGQEPVAAAHNVMELPKAEATFELNFTVIRLLF